MTGSNQDLGRLTRVDLRDIWQSEPNDFTPWLAQEENLKILSETLGIELEFEAQEKAVGPFRADILCKDIETELWVLVENQLERTDHDHLGKLLTYASGLEAVIIVWIAARFTNEHRSTLDWLNKITNERFGFFGLEVELWKIGDSPVAPKFNIVSKPNDWSRSVTQAARKFELYDKKIKQKEYWTAFLRVLDQAEGPVSGAKRIPRPQRWMNHGIGRVGFHLATVIISKKRKIRTELYIKGVQPKAFFHLLYKQQQKIENELGYKLEWKENPEGANSLIGVYMTDVDSEDERDWPRQHEWLAARINEFHTVFVDRVRELDADDWRQED